ncbi:MAG: hypothetical protein R3Y06_11540, partial [Faecalibacterium sp.]
MGDLNGFCIDVPLSFLFVRFTFLFGTDYRMVLRFPKAAGFGFLFVARRAATHSFFQTHCGICLFIGSACRSGFCLLPRRGVLLLPPKATENRNRSHAVDAALRGFSPLSTPRCRRVCCLHFSPHPSAPL